MENKGVSLNLVLRKKGSPDALKSVSEPFRKDASEIVSSPQQGDIPTPWGWYSRLSKEDKTRWEERQKAQGYTPPDTSEKVPVIGEDTSRGFLERRGVCSAALDVFPDWQGVLVNSKVLQMSLWLVRNRRDGEELAQETGNPALLLDDVLSQKGRTREEAQAALLPLLITPGGMQ